MPKRLVVLAIALMAVLICALGLHAQNEKWNNNPPPPPRKSTASQQAAPAPIRDLTGIWAAQGGAGAKGPREYPDDVAHVGHDVPYTPLGKAARMKNKPNEGEQQVSTGVANDPVNMCDPEGFPRTDLYELRGIEFRQAAHSVVILDQFGDSWRKIWTDGRALPTDPDPRWNGYSVGNWIDDSTFVVQTVGMDERTWLDNVGRPHSNALRVEERFHRVDHDTIELTLTITDPNFYTQPSIALNKLPLRLLPPDFDGTEIICSPSELAEYNRQVSSGH
jgi:hypothetical protein